jgi:3-oxoacyl-[acyl-carrier-protein] synthase I
MRRVVVTGLGIISSIGTNMQEVIGSLRDGRSGVRFNQQYADLGLRCHVDGSIPVDCSELIERKLRRFMGDAAVYGYVALRDAIEDACLTANDISHPRTGLIMGSGGASHANTVAAADMLRARGIRRVGPYQVPRTMSSTISANLATAFQIKGLTYSISSACATSSHCIGSAYEQILFGKQDLMFSGGAEEVHWTSTMMFDAMGALATKYNDTPETASRPYDINRDGFVFSGGGGVLVLEELAHAQARGAKIYAELVGYGATTDGYDMVTPSGEGAARSMMQAMECVSNPIDYINTHGTSTPAGDIRELEAIKVVFGAAIPPLSSTKSLTGHALGAAGVHEAIYCLLMMQQGFIAASSNIDQIDPAASAMPIVRERRDNISLDTVMSNSFGFGGTNATLVFSALV